MNKHRGLTTQDIFTKAVTLADAEGIDRLTMRRLAQELGVEAMSIYHHVANKEALLDGMVDAVFTEIHDPVTTGEWREELAARARSARAALLRHRWALGLMDSRTAPGIATLRHHDAVLGCLRAAGFSLAATGHAVALLDAQVYGFVLQELALPFETEDDMAPVAAGVLSGLPTDELPYLYEFMTEHALVPGYDFGAEFEVLLGLALDTLDRLRDEGVGR